MKFGVREICDVVFKAKSTMTVGKKKFYKDEPVIYFDSLKTSTLEGAVTTVYAQGGRGNARLMAWDGEKTVTFTMEDALISPLGLQILAGAGLVEAAPNDKVTENIEVSEHEAAAFKLTVEKNINTDKSIKVVIANGNYGSFVYQGIPEEDGVISVSNDNEITIIDDSLIANELKEATATVTYYAAGASVTGAGKSIKVHTTCQTRPTDVLPTQVEIEVEGKPYTVTGGTNNEHYIYVMALDENGDVQTEPYCVDITVDPNSHRTENGKSYYTIIIPKTVNGRVVNDLAPFAEDKAVLVDYYTEKESGVTQINITPSSLGGNFYVEASTLFRNQQGVDMPAEFIIPNGKVQSNFTFSMASTGDPSTFTFTMDAFPDYTRFDLDEKVFASIQIIAEEESESGDNIRKATAHDQYKVATEA